MEEIPKKINRWTVLKEVERRGYKRYFLCRCDCGTVREVWAFNFTNGISKSCGCYQREVVKNKKTHGMTDTRFYRIYHGIKERCLNPHRKEYKRYGGRGIQLCKWWLDFSNFKNDMFPTYKDNLTIDRIDNNGNYCKENCRWIPFLEQSQNRRMYKLTKEKVLEIRDKYYKKCISKVSLAKEYGVTRAVIWEVVNYSRNYGKIL